MVPETAQAECTKQNHHFFGASAWMWVAADETAVPGCRSKSLYAALQPLALIMAVYHPPAEVWGGLPASP